MKKISLVLLILLVIFTSNMSANVLRVNNVSGTGAAFSTLQNAHDNANAGDTLMIEPGSPYGQLVVTKRLVILGPGYFLGENSETQGIMATVQVDSMTFNAGAEQTLVSGLHFVDRIFINTNNITLSQNLMKQNLANSNYYFINIADNLSQITIKKNYINNTIPNYENNIIIGDGSTVTIRNNFIFGSTYSSNRCIKSHVNGTVILINNVIRGALELYSATVKNNIWFMDYLYGTFPAGGGFNNITENGELTSGTDQTVADMTTVYIGEGSTDGQYQLVETTSPAIGAGEGGIDCGMFGGPDPYILSGINQTLPRIYYLFTSGEGNSQDGLQIHIKAKVND